MGADLYLQTTRVRLRQLGADTVFAVTDAENAASRRVMVKCGLSFGREYEDAEWNRKTVRYALGKEGWKR